MNDHCPPIIAAVMGALVGFVIAACIAYSGRKNYKQPVIYKRNVIEVYYEADENGIRRGDNVITIDLSGTNPKLIEKEQ